MNNVSKRFISFATILIIIFICEIKSECSLSIETDLGSPGPVFLRNGEFMTANTKTGLIKFSRSEILTVACPGNKRRIVLGNDTTNFDVLAAQCIVDKTFKVGHRLVNFKDIRCNTQPWYTAQEYPGTCHGHNTVYHVGYRIKHRFYSLYEACFDKNLLHTHYVKHQISPMSAHMQPNVARPKFIEGDLYGKVKMNEVYRLFNQKLRLDATLGANMASRYLSKTQFLTRGHLAARADFTTSAETRATFHFVNTAPQWMKGNAGDWAALEEALRRRVQALGINVTVYTGTHGVMTLPNRSGHMKEVFLHTDENNNVGVPVPMYYYKLVYDPASKTAAAFISINSSFYNDPLINSLVFCENICDKNPKYSWLRWRPNDGTFSFCCDYNQFVDEVNYLPKLNVKGRFH